MCYTLHIEIMHNDNEVYLLQNKKLKSSGRKRQKKMQKRRSMAAQSNPLHWMPYLPFSLGSNTYTRI